MYIGPVFLAAISQSVCCIGEEGRLFSTFPLLYLLLSSIVPLILSKLLVKFSKGLFLIAIYDHSFWNMRDSGCWGFYLWLYWVSIGPSKTGNENLGTIVAILGQCACKNYNWNNVWHSHPFVEHVVIGAESVCQYGIQNVPHTMLRGALHCPVGLMQGGIPHNKLFGVIHRLPLVGGQLGCVDCSHQISSSVLFQSNGEVCHHQWYQLLCRQQRKLSQQSY